MDFFYALLARLVVLSFPFVLFPIVIVSQSSSTTNVVDLRPLLGSYALPAAFILAAGNAVVRRLHDVNLSGSHAGWLCFCLVLGQALQDRIGTISSASWLDLSLGLFAVAPKLMIFALMLWPGTKRSNQYGPAPA